MPTWSGTLRVHGIGSSLLRVLDGKIVLTPSLRRMIEALPADPRKNPDQLEAISGLVVLNAWLCSSERALVVLREIDDATQSVLGLYPRDATIVARSPEDARRCSAEVVSLATKLGISPARRMRVAILLGECVTALVGETDAVRVDLKVLADRRGVSAEIAALGDVKDPRRARAGSGSWLGLPRLRPILDDLTFSTDERARPRIRGTFTSDFRGSVK
jgi:hypothetical protein